MSVRIVVVGAGPAGTATALVLARAGLTVTVLERETALGRVFRGEGLMPSGVDALDQLGLGDALEQGAIPSRRVESWHIWIDGREVLVVPEPLAALGHRATRVISHPALLQRLVAAAGEAAAFRLELGARVTRLRRDGGGRVVGVRADVAGEAREVPADLVLGCDGHGSQVRRLAGLALTTSPEQYDVLWCKVPAPAPLQGGVSHDAHGGRRQGPGAVLHHVGRAAAVRPHPAQGPVRSRRHRRERAANDGGDNGDGGEVGGLGGGSGASCAAVARRPPASARRGEAEGPTRLNVLVGRCPAWAAPGVLLLGDAAHPMSPVRAQGLNLALRDAIVAANHPSSPAARAGAAGLDAAARAVQTEREPEIVRAQALQRREAQGQGDARSATWRFALARSLAPALGRFRWAQRAWLARQHDLRFGSTTVVLDPSLRVAGGPPTGGPPATADPAPRRD